MKLRPCIDIHNGKVKQIVGSTLRDEGSTATDNFVSEKGGEYYGNLYKEKNLPGGHIILLNSRDSEYYEQDLEVAKAALNAYPGGLMIGGGVNAENASHFLDMGASHVIVTSYVFTDGKLNMERLLRLIGEVGSENICLDLSCRKKGDRYYIVTDRWQKFTDMEVSPDTLGELSDYAGEFLIHGVDVEGKSSGIDEGLIRILSEFDRIPVTYAGGISSFSDIDKVRNSSDGKLDITIGSALSIFGGNLELDELMSYIAATKQPHPVATQ